MQTSLFANTRGLKVKRIISCHYVLWSIRDKGTKRYTRRVHIFTYLSVRFTF